jgi:hypothetical protein
MAKRSAELQNYCTDIHNNIVPGTADTEGDLQRELHILHAAQLVENTTVNSLMLQQNIRDMSQQINAKHPRRMNDTFNPKLASE